MLDALPDYLDLDPATSNLSAYEDFASLDEGDSNILRLGPIEDWRMDWGGDLASTLALGAHGYVRSGGDIWSTLLWGFAGYLVPLPAAGVAVFQAATRR